MDIHLFLKLQFLLALEAQIRNMQEKRRNLDPEDEPPEKENRVALNAVGDFDGDLYSGGKSKFEGYHTSLAVDDVEVSNEILFSEVHYKESNQARSLNAIYTYHFIVSILGRRGACSRRRRQTSTNYCTISNFK